MAASIERARGKYYTASFVSGSQRFVEGLIQALVEGGLRQPRLLTLERLLRGGARSRTFYFKYYGRDVSALARFLYEGVPEGQLLCRKRDAFYAACMAHSERGRSFFSGQGPSA